jgi:DNA-binding transcriptional regulator YhcF (GntR family)
MRDESNHEHFADEYTERLVVLQVLGHGRGYPLARLLADLDDIEPQLVKQAIASLEEAGVVRVTRARVHPSAAMQRLDDLTMICV